MAQGTVNVIYKDVAYITEKAVGGTGMTVAREVKQKNIKAGKGISVPMFPTLKQLVPGSFKHPNWKI